MFRICLYLVILFLSSQIQAQNDIDSLRALLSGPLSDTARVQVLNSLSSRYFYKNPKATDSLASIAVELSKSINYPAGTASSLRNKGISYAIRGEFEQARAYYHEALEYLHEPQHEKEKPGLYYAIGITYTETGKYREAEASFLKGLKQQKDLSDSVGIANSYVALANFHKKISQYTVSASYLDSAVAIYEVLDMSSELAIVQGNRANVFMSLDNYPKALEAAQMALIHSEENNLDQKSAINYHTIGAIYNHLEELDTAKSYYQKSYALKKKLGMVQGMAFTLSNLGALLIKKEEYESAKATFQQVAHLYDSLHLTCTKPYAELNLGIIYLKTGRKDSAHFYLNRALETSKSCQLNEIASQSLIHLGEWYEAEGQLNKAEDAYLQSMKIGDEDSIMSIRADAARHLYLVYKAQNNPLQAFKYLEIASALQDSLYNEENNRKIARIESKYLFDKEKALMNEEFEKGQIQQAAEVEKQILFRDMAMAIAALMLTIVIGTTVVFVKLKRSKNLLFAQNQQITAQKERLEDLNKSNDKLFSLLSHDLRNPLHGIQGIISMLRDGNVTKDEVAQLSTDTDIRIRSLLQFLDNVLYWSQHSFSTLLPKNEEVNINEIIHETILLLRPISDQKRLTIHFDAEASYLLQADEAMLKIAFRNIISNAIKFSFDGSQIDIKTRLEKGEIQVSVCDYGLGMSEDTVRKLFSETMISKEGTHNEMGAGLGLYLSHDFVKLNGGKIDVQSEEGKGSVFAITLPASDTIRKTTA